jgi:DNA-nicking Smr family endonuclease
VKPKQGKDDTALFREATRDVKPLSHAPRVVGDAPKPRARARFTRAERLRVLEEPLHGPVDDTELSAADPTSFARPGVSAITVRKLRRGQYRIQAQLDLHGLIEAEAEIQLREFLIMALQRNLRCVRIVHGKGLRSGPNGAVLRKLVNRALGRTRQVLAFASARPVDGGTGAVYVLLEGAA